MRDFIETSIDYIKNIPETGAITQTSKYVEEVVIKHIDISKKQLIVEFGAGLGNITKKILSIMNVDSELYAFETNKDFCDKLNKIRDKRLFVINKSATELFDVCSECGQVDLIISTIPLTIIPNDEINKILESGNKTLKKNGFFIQVLYTGIYLNKFKKYFKNCKIKIIRNMPVVFLHTSQKL